MTVSSIAIGIGRVSSAEAVTSKLGHTADGARSIFPIQIPHGAAVPAVTVNRLFERKEGGETSVVLAITVMAKTVQEIEDIGETIIDELDGTTDFVFADLIGITFDKAGPDVTGYDSERSLMLRQVEWVITY